MGVTKDQAEMFFGVAAGLKMGIIDVSKDILEQSVLVGAEMICESQGEIDNLTEQLSTQVSASTRNNHMRIKELEDKLSGVVQFIDSMWDFDCKDEEHFDELQAVSNYKKSIVELLNKGD